MRYPRAVAAGLPALIDAVHRGRRAAYDLGLLRRKKIDGLSVVSVGGLAFGGEGKTPLALYVAERLAARAVPTAVVLRGYRGSWERRGGVVSEGQGPLTTAAEAGDEALLAALRLPGVAVVVGADRVAAAGRARALGARVAVLDSGFSHLRLARELDVLVLSKRTIEDGRAFPFGPCREPASAAERADLLAYLDVGEGALLPARGISFRLEPEALVGPGLEVVGRPEELGGRRVLVLAGIARPGRLGDSARSLGATVVGSLYPGDHHPYGAGDRAAIAERGHALGADLVLTTEKDMVRLGPIRGMTVLALRVRVEVSSGQRLLDGPLEGLGRGVAPAR